MKMLVIGALSIIILIVGLVFITSIGMFESNAEATDDNTSQTSYNCHNDDGSCEMTTGCPSNIESEQEYYCCGDSG